MSALGHRKGKEPSTGKEASLAFSYTEGKERVKPRPREEKSKHLREARQSPDRERKGRDSTYKE